MQQLRYGYSLAPAALVCALFVWGAKHVGQIPRVFAGRYHQNYSIDLRVGLVEKRYGSSQNQGLTTTPENTC